MSETLIADTASTRLSGNRLSESDIERIRRDFPALHQEVHGHPLAYLDNAASSQTPSPVLDAMMAFYERDRANIHRGVHELSQRSTLAYEGVRETLRRFLNAESEREIVFTRGATEAINLVARSFVAPRLEAGDEVLITHLEHHANIVPWQLVCQEAGARLRVVPIDDRGDLLVEAVDDLLGERTRILALGHISNALGTINPVKALVEQAHGRGIPVLIDGAQAVPHMAVDVRDLDCDFYVFSGHKMFAPTGSGALYGKLSRLQEMRPWQGGGDMILSVTFEKTDFQEPPHRFEAGTPDIGAVVGLGAAVDYLEAIGLEAIGAYEHELLDYATRRLAEIPEVQLIGTARQKAAVLSFNVEGAHPHDVGTILDQRGVAVRAGHHCAQPLMERFRVPATARASFAFYNTFREADALVDGIREVLEVFA